MEEENIITRKGYDEASGIIVEKTLKYRGRNHDAPYAYGTPITAKLAIHLIDNYWQTLDKVRDKESEVAFVFGKDSLLSILSQEGCVGVKFYIAKKTNDSSQNGKTLVALGVNNEKQDICSLSDNNGVRDTHIVGPLVRRYSDNKLLNDFEEGEIREMVPPDTLGYYFSRNVKPEDKSFAELVQLYFNSKK
ncbi:MAG: hypothetical protein EHM93_04850 [Bacteroidales bacterium]|nr:MAG: hypothetical protein EHM93_04850 [Bacteroidales bacterium]